MNVVIEYNKYTQTMCVCIGVRVVCAHIGSWLDGQPTNMNWLDKLWSENMHARHISAGLNDGEKLICTLLAKSLDANNCQNISLALRSTS